MHQKGASHEEENASSSTLVPGEKSLLYGKCLYCTSCASVVLSRKQSTNSKDLWCGELWSQCSGQERAGAVQLSSHWLLCSWAGKHSGYATPSQSCHSAELPVVCSQNGILLYQPKEGCPAACKAPLWWCAGCHFWKLSALLCSDKRLTVKMWSGRV